MIFSAISTLATRDSRLATRDTRKKNRIHPIDNDVIRETLHVVHSKLAINHSQVFTMRRISNARRTLYTLPLLASLRRMSETQAFIPMQAFDVTRLHRHSCHRLFSENIAPNTIKFQSNDSVKPSDISNDVFYSKIQDLRSDYLNIQGKNDPTNYSSETKTDIPSTVTIHNLLVSYFLCFSWPCQMKLEAGRGRTSMVVHRYTRYRRKALTRHCYVRSRDSRLNLPASASPSPVGCQSASDIFSPLCQFS